MGKNKRCQYQMCYDNPPETLDEHMFFGMTVDPDQKAFRDAIWDKTKVAIFCDAKSGSGKTMLATAVGTLLVKYGFYDGIVYVMAK